jgi:hypothetical protein
VRQVIYTTECPKQAQASMPKIQKAFNQRLGQGKGGVGWKEEAKT